MNFFKVVYIFICLFSFSIWTEELNEPIDSLFQSSLMNTQSLLSTTVDSVSVISGEWLNSEVDFIVPGPEPLILSRGYSSQGIYNKKLAFNWNFNRPYDLQIYNKEKDGYERYSACFNQPSGVRTRHKSPKKRYKKNIPLKLYTTKGLTNCRSGEISAKTNLHNTMLLLSESQEHCTAISGSRHIIYFKKIDEPYSSPVSLYKPIFERKANGHLVKFNTREISAFNPNEDICYSWIKFKKQDVDLLKVYSSDDKYAFYKFEMYDFKIIHVVKEMETEIETVMEFNRSGKFCLKEIDFKHKPKVKFEYNQNAPKENPTVRLNPLLTSKSWPEGRFQKVKYYKKGKNTLDKIGSQIIDDNDDFRINRVKTIQAPVGTTDLPIITKQFIYRKKAHNPTSNIFSSQYSTEVYDAYLRKTIFWYNKENRATLIEKFDVNNKLYCSEGMVWDERYFGMDKDDSSEENYKKKDIAGRNSQNLQEADEMLENILPKEFRANLLEWDFFKKHIKENLKDTDLVSSGKGNLEGKYLKDADGNIIHATYFDYDNKGNVLSERFYGNLTGSNQTNIQLDAYRYPINNGVDCYRKKFRYSNNSFNLLLSEQEDNGKGIIYVYRKHSDLITAKYVTENRTIRFRQFFEYDENTTLTKLIKDDGSTRDPNDLTDVTERRITYFFPQKIAPFGLPKRIMEKYWDFITGKEKLLKRVDCEYNLRGQIVKQRHFDANNDYCYTLNWKYNDHGNVVSETNAIGQTISKKYDANDNLIFVQGLDPNYHIENSYDFANRLIKTVEHHKNGHSFSISYEYDYLGNKTSQIDRFGCETNYYYDAFSRLIKTQQPEFINIQGNHIRPTEKAVYDAANSVISKTDASGRRTIMSYNARGEPISIVYPDGTIESFEYYLDGTLAKSIAKNGTKTIYHRDYLGRITLKSLYDENDVHLGSESFIYQGLRLISKIDAEGCTTLYTYDGAGRVITQSCGNSYQTFTYDSLNRVCKESQLYGNADELAVKVLKYDYLNRIIEETLEDSKGTILQNVSYTYDVSGNVTRKSNLMEAGANTTCIKYNSDQKPILIKDALGGKTRITYKYNHINELGQNVLKVIATDPLGRTTHQIYDSLGRISDVFRNDSFGVEFARQKIIYDVLGRIKKTIETVMIDGQILRQSINSHYYHINGQEELTVQEEGTADQRTTRILFNAYGEKEKIIKPDGVHIDHKYDAFGRLKNISSGDGTINYSYQYNLCHQVTQVEDHINQTLTTRSYDSQGLMLNEILANELELDYQYDRTGRLTELKLPDRSSINYVYDAAYLKAVQRIKQDKIVYEHLYETHDQKGSSLDSAMIGKSGKLNCRYDKLNRIATIDTLHWSQNIPEIGHDAAGRMKSNCVKDIKGSVAYEFDYDELDHLKSEKGHFSHTFLTDSIHNRLKKNEDIYHVNNLNQLTRQKDCEYRYDMNGNVLQKIQGENIVNYAYDAFNRLTEVKDRNNLTSYLYDAFNRRIEKSHNGKISRYLYQGSDEIGSVNPNNVIDELRVLGIGLRAEMGAAIAIELEDRIYAPIHDRQGHVACLIDSLTGNHAESYRYSAFGEEIIFNNEGVEIDRSQIGNPWRFASKRNDSETGWIYFGRRYYDPEIGRWTTPDPLSFADGPNLYAYLHHNPLMSLDAYGLMDEAIRAYDDSVTAANNAPSILQEALSCRDSNNSDQESSMGGSTFSMAGQGFSSLCRGLWNGTANPLGTSWNYSGQIVTFSCNVWQIGFSGMCEQYSNANSNEIFTKICETTGEIGGICISLLYIPMIAENMFLASCRLAQSTFGLVRQNTSRILGSLRQSSVAGFGKAPATLAIENAASYSASISFTTEIAESIVVNERSFCLKQLCESGKRLDRSGLTQAGRSLDKHGNRVGTPFPKATGNVASKNNQGQYQLESILYDPNKRIVVEKKGFEIYSENRGAFFNLNGEYRGFLSE